MRHSFDFQPDVEVNDDEHAAIYADLPSPSAARIKWNLVARIALIGALVSWNGASLLIR